MGKEKILAGVKPEKLELWQKRLAEADAGFSGEREKMDHREKLYRGESVLEPLVKGDKQGKKPPHVRNIIFENIETQISSAIPQPKVTACRKKDEPLAAIIENFLRNELDRMDFEVMNDLAERTVPIQGGVLFLTEWDNLAGTHTTLGQLEETVIHPKQLAPQPGVYTGLKDMDWFIVKIPTTKAEILRKYGVDLRDEGEAEPQIRGTGDEDVSLDAITQYIGYQKGERGGIDRYSWACDRELEDLEDYQARRQEICARCGAPKTAGAEGGTCPGCGGTKWETRVRDHEEILVPVVTAMGHQIPGMVPGLGELGQEVMVPTKVPFYKPDVYPLVLQRSVSVFGQLLGNSDVDAIEDQQNTVNRMEKKIIDRFMKAGTRITLPNNAALRVDPEDQDVWYIDNAAQASLVNTYDFTGNLANELNYLAQVYEEGRQALGVTNSYQGRPDATATSGKAKEYAAAQAAGRLESKRVMKNAAYAAMFELMFKFQLAYADEPRPIRYRDHKGETQYGEFNRYDFLEQDAAGEWYWNDAFLFSVDTAGTLASNREAMWQETRQNFQSGTFGDPAATETQVLFWTKMELLHYPGAGDTRKYLEEKLVREQEAARQAQMMQLQMQQQQAAVQQLQTGRPPVEGLPPPGATMMSAAQGQPI